MNASTELQISEVRKLM